jgi:protein-disulfide isomerase
MELSGYLNIFWERFNALLDQRRGIKIMSKNYQNSNNFKINENNGQKDRKGKRKLLSRIILWASAVIIISAAVWGLLKIANNLSPASQNINISISNSDWVKGARNAKVILLEYSDFQCPACALYAPVLNELEEEFRDKIALVYRHFPLKMIHKDAELAARAAEAAGRQNKFWAMHDMIFNNQDEWAAGGEAKDFFIKYAQALNLNVEQFKNDINSKQVKDEVNDDYQSGLSAGINYTPAFFLNGKKITPKNYEDFRKIIGEAVKQN